jgi:imidazolonepropionase-like amidohydrolase
MSAARLVLRGVAALDASGRFDGPLDVAVDGGAIAAVAPSLPGRDGVDAAGLFLMPGVIDCHVHLGWRTWDTLELLSQSLQRWTLEAAACARRTLEAGVTTVRDAGGVDAGFRDALADGVVPGPAVQAAVVLLSQTGGHGDGFLAGPGLEASSQYLTPDWPGRPPVRVDGPEEMRRVVRSVLRAGADWVKLCTTGGVLSPHDHPTTGELTDEEVAVAVFEAARRGRSVMAHANGGEGLDVAIRCGVRSIEHGAWLTEEQAAAMAARGTWLVPTLQVMRDAIAWGEAGRLPAYALPKAAELSAVWGEAVRIARASGVPIALGSDALTAGQHGANLEEVALLGDAGLAPHEALLAATARGAELLGLGATHGRIAPGFAFDAILFDEDPSDLALFRRRDAVRAVFQAGRVVVGCERLGMADTGGAGAGAGRGGAGAGGADAGGADAGGGDAAVAS